MSKKTENLKQKIENLKLKKELNQEKTFFTKLSGLILWLLCAFGMVASSSIAIAGGYKSYTGFEQYAYIFFIAYVELSIFFVSNFETSIKSKFYRHYTKVKILQIGLLAIIIYLNFNFFLSKMPEDSSWLLKVMTFILCILVDYGTMSFLSLSADRLFYNLSFKTVSYEGLFSKILFNLTYNFRNKIEQKYIENTKKQLNSFQDRDIKQELTYNKLIENKELENSFQDRTTENEIEYKEEIELRKPLELVQDKDIETVKKTILNYQDNNICPPVAALEQLTGLTKNKIVAIKKSLELDGFIKTEGNKTLVMGV